MVNSTDHLILHAGLANCFVQKGTRPTILIAYLFPADKRRTYKQSQYVTLLTEFGKARKFIPAYELIK